MQQNAALSSILGYDRSRPFRSARSCTQGVPAEAILIENRSRNTGENFRFTRQVLESRGLDFSSFIMVQKPYMERRVLATAQQQWSRHRLRSDFAAHRLRRLPQRRVAA